MYTNYDNKQLLMEVLKVHFKDRYFLVEDALNEINKYVDHPNKTTYKETLNKLYSVMNGDLPPQILLYFLTMVPLPNFDKNETGDVLGLMKKTHDSLPNNMRPILLSYLKEMSSVNVLQTDISIANNEYINEIDLLKDNNDNSVATEDPFCCGRLVDICAKYIFANMGSLKKMYEDQNNYMWKLIHSCDNDSTLLRQCYKMVEYLNKKRKLLRMIEDDEISLDVFQEEYGNSEVFLKQNHFVNGLEGNLLETSDVLSDAIGRFCDRC